MLLGIDGLDGVVGAGAVVTLLTVLSTMFALLVNAFLKTASKSDEIAQRLVSDKDARITELELRIHAVEEERDYWFRKYDEERGRRGT